MIEGTKLDEEINELDGLIEDKVKVISKKLEVTQKIEAVEDDAAELNWLIGLRKSKGRQLKGGGKSAPPRDHQR
jgi:hypothetical protein